jgi:hypothetical protein
MMNMRQLIEAAEGKGRAKPPSGDAVKRLADKIVAGRAKVAMGFTGLPLIELYPPGPEHGAACGKLLPELMDAIEEALPRVQGHAWVRSVGYANYENKIRLQRQAE